MVGGEMVTSVTFQFYKSATDTSKSSPTYYVSDVGHLHILSLVSDTNIDVNKAFSTPKCQSEVGSRIIWDSGVSVADDVSSIRWILGVARNVADSFFVNFRNISGAN